MQRKDLRQAADPALTARLAATLRGRDTFAELAAPLVARLVEASVLLDADPGEALIRENEPGAPEVYLLLEGALEVRSQGQFIARLDRPGDVAGEVAVLMSSKRTADVVAGTTSRLLAVPAAVLAKPEFEQVAAALRRLMLRDDWVQY